MTQLEPLIGEPNRRRSRILTPAWIVATGALVVFRLAGPDLFGIGADGWRLVFGAAELFVVGGVLLLALWSLPFDEITTQIGPLRTAVVGLILTLTVFGHFAPSTDDAYPFLTWDMYTSPGSTMHYFEVRLLDDGRDAGPLPLADSFPSSKRPRAFLNRIGTLALQAEAGDAASGDTVDAALGQFVVQRGDTDADTIEVRLCAVEDPDHRVPASCRVVRTVRLGP